MNVKLFKKLIKDAVTETLYEELPEIINEVMSKREKQLLEENQTISFSSNDVAHTPLPNLIRQQLSSKIGASLGLIPQTHQPVLKDKETTIINGNPYESFINDAVANMTPQQYSGLKNLG